MELNNPFNTIGPFVVCKIVDNPWHTNGHTHISSWFIPDIQCSANTRKERSRKLSQILVSQFKSCSAYSIHSSVTTRSNSVITCSNSVITRSNTLKLTVMEKTQ